MSGNDNNNNNSYSFPIIISELLGAVVLIGMVNGENICSWAYRGWSEGARVSFRKFEFLNIVITVSYFLINKIVLVPYLVGLLLVGLAY